MPDVHPLPDLARLHAPHRRPEPVLLPSGEPGRYDSEAVDCPFVFRHRDRFYMMHIGFDGRGYQTALAASDDLLAWTRLGVILGRGTDDSRWDHVGAAGSWMLLESSDLDETPRLKKVDGRYWMIYHAYPDFGYEEGGAAMGLAWCEDEELLEWHRLPEPVMTFGDGGEWERGGLYKCCLLEHEGRYWMFYNAKEKPDWPWIEQTGLAWSDDLRVWQRHPANPLLAVSEGTFYSRYVSDPCIRFDKPSGWWVNFGFGFDGEHAQGLLALSRDLESWRILPEPSLPHGAPGEIDQTHAHKSFVVRWKGTLYHFYCACRPARPGDPAWSGAGGELRSIAVATSRPL
ncbi:hypothetical protein NYE40_03755 [Paenibacillus sp. FSL W8-1187]|uniref:Beta-galactosidase n=1 Tax=Paenibacillus pasadenensis TaxID=217090 RepID=A0A2N5N1L2_9BACL|nr:hypothetical protein [Paenibacillus pasadenensis]PLT44227.1 Beta-galactosidase [Paenibacillus pasadenensis]